MALQANIQTPYGVEAQYWVISRISIDRKNLSAQVSLEGYASQEAEEAGKAPLSAREFEVKFSENPKESNAVIPEQAITPELIAVFEALSKFGYGLVKQAEEFNAST